MSLFYSGPGGTEHPIVLCACLDSPIQNSLVDPPYVSRSLAGLRRESLRADGRGAWHFDQGLFSMLMHHMNFFGGVTAQFWFNLKFS